MLRFLLGIILILGPSNLASSFLSVLPEEVKEKEKYEKNGQQCFDILLTCLCIMKYWICGSCCAYHSSGGRNLKWKMSQILCFLTFPLLRCTSFVPWLSSPCLFSGPRCPPTGFDLRNQLYSLLIICCLILDINYSSYSLIFFALPKVLHPLHSYSSSHCSYGPHRLWWWSWFSSLIFQCQDCELIFRFILSRLNLHNDGSCDRALYYSLSPVLQDHSQLGGSQVSWWWLLNFCTFASSGTFCRSSPFHWRTMCRSSSNWRLRGFQVSRFSCSVLSAFVSWVRLSRTE